MSRPMTFQELVDVMKFIANNNSPFTVKSGVPVVKYANPVLDFRTNTCFSITLRGFGTERVFHCQNECRSLPQTLKERVMAYLEGKDTAPAEFTDVCIHCGVPVKQKDGQWHGAGVLPQYCYADPVGGSQLHEVQPWTREELERGRAM